MAEWIFFISVFLVAAVVDILLFRKKNRSKKIFGQKNTIWYWIGEVLSNIDP